MPTNDSPYEIVATSGQSANTYSFHITMNGSPVNADFFIFAWTFGDGGTSDEATPTHTFGTGNFTVACQVDLSTDPKPEGDEGTTGNTSPPPPIIISTT